MEKVWLLTGNYKTTHYIYEGKKQEVKALVERVGWNAFAGTNREDCFAIIAHLYGLAMDTNDKNLDIDLSVLLDKLDKDRRRKMGVVFIDL